jgi:hypothetical protein
MPITGHCHCGNLAFRIDGEIPEKLTWCTCTFCSKRAALVAYFPPEKVEITQKSSDAIYRWNTKLVAHHFCSKCGIGVYSDSPAFEQGGKWDGKTRRVSVNARLFEGYDASKAPVEVIDGKNLW